MYTFQLFHIWLYHCNLDLFSHLLLPLSLLDFDHALPVQALDLRLELDFAQPLPEHKQLVARTGLPQQRLEG